MAILGIALIFGGIKCLRASSQMFAAYYKTISSLHLYQIQYHEQHDFRPDKWAMVAGFVLLGLGSVSGLGALLPASVFENILEKFSSPP